MIDSGAHYNDGTTDISRTISFCTQSERIKNVFTRVLKGHIALAQMIFPENVTGNELDLVARKYLWEDGLEYDHGTGHGVGYVSSVHESAPNVSRKISGKLCPGMILSNEPGYYLQGEFGIRLENLLLVKNKITTNKNSFLCFETISFCPIEKDLINFSMLNNLEKKWLQKYNERIRKLLKPLLSYEEYIWLQNETTLIN